MVNAFDIIMPVSSCDWATKRYRIEQGYYQKKTGRANSPGFQQMEGWAPVPINRYGQQDRG